jgi:hemolysin activation/secretion protein
MNHGKYGANTEELLTMNPIKFLSLALAACAVLSPPGLFAQDLHPAPPGQPAPVLGANGTARPAAPVPDTAPPMDNLDKLNGVIIYAPFDPSFSLEGVTNKVDRTVIVKGPDFLKRHEGRVRAVVEPYLGKPLTTNGLRHMQRDLILLCRSLDRPWVDVYYPQQAIVPENAVVQLVVYEGHVNTVSAHFLGRKWFSERFITNNFHIRTGDPISQKQLMADVNRVNASDQQFLEVNVDVKQGEFDDQQRGGTNTTDIDILVKDRFPVRVYGGYDDYGVRVLGENRVFAGLNYGNVWGLAHQFNYQYTTDLDFDHLRSHTASYVAPLPWGDTVTVFGGYSDLNSDLSSFSPLVRSSGDAYQISARYTMPLPEWGRFDESLALGYDFKYANTPLEFNQVAVNSFRAAIDQFVATYHARLPDSIGWKNASGGYAGGYTQLDASAYYSPGGMLGPNSTEDFASYQTNQPDLKANYYYGHVNGERGFYLPLNSLLKLEGGYQVSSERLLPSEEMYLGGDQMLRGYPENAVAGDDGWNATAEWHLPIIGNGSVFFPKMNITRQENLPGGVTGDTLDFFGFYDYGAVRPSGAVEELPHYYLESAGGGLNLRVSQNLTVNFAYGYQLKQLPTSLSLSTVNPTPLLSGRRSGALVSATLSF